MKVFKQQSYLHKKEDLLRRVKKGEKSAPKKELSENEIVALLQDLVDKYKLSGEISSDKRLKPLVASKEEFRKEVDKIRAELDVVIADIEKLLGCDFKAEGKNIPANMDGKKEFIRTLVANKLREYDLRLEVSPYVEADELDKKLLRMEFNGIIRKPAINQLSEAFRNQEESNKTYTSKDYNLEDSPAWSHFARFASVKKLSGAVCRALADYNINPAMLKEMNFYDFAYLLYKRYARANDDGVRFDEISKGVDGSKKAFVKQFIRKNEQAFREQLSAMDDPKVSPQYIEALVKCMKETGTMNPPVTRDEHGKILVGPEFSIHHKKAIQDAGQSEDYTERNRFENFVIIIDTKNRPYHPFIHSTDKPPYYEKDGKKYVERLQLPDGVCFYGGSKKSMQIYNTPQDSKENARPQVKQRRRQRNG